MTVFSASGDFVGRIDSSGYAVSTETWLADSFRHESTRTSVSLAYLHILHSQLTRDTVGFPQPSVFG